MTSFFNSKENYRYRRASQSVTEISALPCHHFGHYF